MSAMASDPSTTMTDAEREALSSRGLAIYDEKLKPMLEPQYDKKCVAIHVETGDYAVADSSGNARRATRKRYFRRLARDEAHWQMSRSGA